MATCAHANEVNVPRPEVPVHCDECCLCFNSPSSPGGHSVCLTCFTGGCNGPHAHAQRHHTVTKHNVVLRHVRTAVPSSAATEIVQVDTLADAAALPETVVYEDAYTAHCFACNVDLSTDASVNPRLAESIAAVRSAAPASTIAAPVEIGEEVASPCPHTEQLSAFQASLEGSLPDLSNAQLAKCTGCDISENLWLCLTCGNLGCSRRGYDGSGGNNHAVDHGASACHGLVLKVGTITPEGAADIWCYDCDRAVVDTELPAHLAAFGIAIQSQKKTAKSLSELQTERNLQATLQSVHDPSGRELALLFGPKLTGCVNIGNSCYASSIIQCLAATPSVAQRYGGAAGREHLATCRSQRPGTCYLCQLSKVFLGLGSGDYSLPPSHETAVEFVRRQRATKDASAAVAADGKPAETATKDAAPVASVSTPQHPAKIPRTASKSQVTAGDLAPLTVQPGVPLKAFKKLLCASHAEFSGTRQQCAYEFLGYLRDQVQRHETALKERGADPFDNTRFHTTMRLECTKCGGVRYTPSKATDLVVPLPDAAVERERALRAAAPPGEVSSHAHELPPVTFEECMRTMSAPQTMEGFNCPQCKEKTVAKTSTGLRTVPETLVVQVRRFGLFDPSSWVPTKLLTGVVFGNGQETAAGRPGPDDAVAMSDTPLPAPASVDPVTGLAVPVADAPVVDLSQFIVGGLKEGEVELPSDDNGSGPKAGAGGILDKLASVNAETVEMIVGFTGMDEERVRYAMVQCDNDGDRAAEWLFSHMDDVVDVAAIAAGEAASGAGAGTDVPVHSGSAKFRLRALVAHEGVSTVSGHYVSYVYHATAPGADSPVIPGEPDKVNTGRTYALSTAGTASMPVDVSGKKLGWVCFNDQKVFQAPDAPTGQAYVFFLERI